MRQPHSSHRAGMAMCPLTVTEVEDTGEEEELTPAPLDLTAEVGTGEGDGLGRGERVGEASVGEEVSLPPSTGESPFLSSITASSSRRGGRRPPGVTIEVGL